MHVCICFFKMSYFDMKKFCAADNFHLTSASCSHRDINRGKERGIKRGKYRIYG
jgi:hypothetical protein